MTRPLRSLLIPVAAAVLLLGGCSAPVQAPAPAPAAPTSSQTGGAATNGALARAGLLGLDAVEVVERVDASPDSRPLPFTASVRSHEVLLADETGSYSLPVPEDRFYISVAPFRQRTHECYNHSLATCQGELAGQQVHLNVTAADGTVLVDRDATLYANGFVGFWVPRDIEGTIRVTQGDLVGEVPFASADESPTCLTTLHLT